MDASTLNRRLLWGKAPLKTLIRLGFCALVAAGALVTVQPKIVLVSGGSMEPTFHSGQPILIARGAAFMNIQDGDMIVFRDNNDGTLIVKRVYKKSGETVDIHHEPAFWGRKDGTYRVPENAFYCLGDNPPKSYDSRAFGAVEADQVVGKVISNL